MAKVGVVLHGRVARRWAREAPRLQARLGALEVCSTSCAGDAVRLAREFAAAGFGLILAAGGDGTLNEVVNGVIGCPHEPAVGFVPLGSGNDFQRTLASFPGEVRMDVIWLRCASNVDRYFVNVASVGLGADTARLGGRMPKALPARLRYLAATLPSLALRRDARVRITLDGMEAEEYGMTTLALANGQYQGGGIHIAPDAQINDGLLNVTLIEPVGLLDLALNTRLLYSGDIYTHPKVRHWRAAHVRVESHDLVPVEVDGDVVGALPLEAEVLPRRLKLAVY